MPSSLQIGKATISDMSNRVDDYQVVSIDTDGATGQKETYYMNSRWQKQWGYFCSIPELKSAILMKAIWDVGKGYTCDERTTNNLRLISGPGKDSFHDILFNAQVIKRIGGDSYTHILKDKQSKFIVNLKPLNPGTIRVVANEKGIIIRYEQVNRLPVGETIIKFNPSEILHFSNNRLADQIHGISDIDALEETIKAEAENFQDMKTIMHRQARPMIIFKLGTDNQTLIDGFVAKMDYATNKGENVYVPDDTNTLSYEVVQVNVSQVILEWRNDLRNKFYRSVGLPQIVPGGSGQSTESESKVIYLAFEQIVKWDQLQIEQQILLQLGLEIKLYAPTSIMDNLATDTAKDGISTFQPNDVQAGSGK